MTFSFVGVLGILCLLGIFIFLVISMQHKNFLNLYFLVLSLVATLGLSISLGFLVEELLEYRLISNEEYTQQQWRYVHCAEENNSDIYIKKTTETPKPTTETPKTEAEIQACEEEALITISEERTYRYQNNLIAQCTWLFVFALLLAVHFPCFLKQQKKTDIKKKKS
jgi:4-amino-4-deoxy-L-arabinose transferase-like glycosyltransferase